MALGLAMVGLWSSVALTNSGQCRYPKGSGRTASYDDCAITPALNITPRFLRWHQDALGFRVFTGAR
jgi:hypothetical protein